MKKELKKEDISDLINKHQDCKNWMSKIKNIEGRIQFMKNMILKFSARLIDKNRVVEMRTFHFELDGELKGRLEWLIQKLEIHSHKIEFSFKENSNVNNSEFGIQHKILENEVSQLQDKFIDMRISFFELLKPSFRKIKLKQRVKNAA